MQGREKKQKQNINGWNAGRLKKTSNKECFFFFLRGAESEHPGGPKLKD